jgi:agmatine deiminase
MGSDGLRQYTAAFFERSRSHAQGVTMKVAGQLLPEWAPVQSVLLVWPYPHGDWQVNYAEVVECYWGILSALSQEITVGLLLHTSLDRAQFEEEVQRRAINAANVKIRVTHYDDTWVRDYGPLSTSAGYIAYTFNGWGGKYSALNDNAVPAGLADFLSAPVTKYDFVCEGGGLETDGETLLVNANCIVDENRNPGWDRAAIENHFRETLGLHKFAWLDDICLTGDDTDGHIDTIARFASPGRVVYAGPSPEHVDAEILASLHQQISTLAQENGWELLALPSPMYRSLVDERYLPCTYANFLIVNDCVFAPIYGLKEDSAAIDVLTKAFPRSRVIPVRCEALLEQHGSLHCATMQIARLP